MTQNNIDSGKFISNRNPQSASGYVLVLIGQFLLILLLQQTVSAQPVIKIRYPAQPKTLSSQEKVNDQGNSHHQPTSYFRRALSYATHPESDPPRYVRKLSDLGIEAFRDITWLDIGLEYRTRLEMRDRDIRRETLTLDSPVLLRSRLWLGIREILDPFRVAVEFQDSRRYHGKFPLNDQDRNSYDLLNAYGELYFKNGLGADDRGQSRPVRLRVGRMAYETLDRRFIGRNEWRNTTNTFEGFRMNLGQENNDWEVDMFAYQPVRRLLDKFDARNKNLWFYGTILHWRKWSEFITLQPYYMGQIQQADPEGHTATNRLDREIHAAAIRGYGVIPSTSVDFDFNLIYQFGKHGNQSHDAYGYTLEAGKTINHPWKPRVSLFYGYATGDRNPDDNENNHFDRFFGFARPWSADHYAIFENIKAPKIKLEVSPVKDLQLETTYSGYWLASSTDRLFDFLNGNDSAIKDPGFNRDRTGSSGDFVGHALEARLRYRFAPYLETVVGYTHFVSGDFVINRQEASIGEHTDDTNFFYVEILVTPLNFLSKK